MAKDNEPGIPLENVQSKVKFRFTEKQIAKLDDSVLQGGSDSLLERHNIVKTADKSSLFASPKLQYANVSEPPVHDCVELNNATFCSKHRRLIKEALNAVDKNNRPDLEKFRKQIYKLETALLIANCPNMVQQIAAMNVSNRQSFYALITLYVHLIDSVNRCIANENSPKIPLQIYVYVKTINGIENTMPQLKKVVAQFKHHFGLEKDIRMADNNVPAILNAFKSRIDPTESFQQYTFPAFTRNITSKEDTNFLKHYTERLTGGEFDATEVALVPDFDVECETEDEAGTDRPAKTIREERDIGLKLDGTPAILGSINGYGGSLDIREAYGYERIDLSVPRVGRVTTFLPPNLVRGIKEGDYEGVKPKIFVVQGALLANELDLRLTYKYMKGEKPSARYVAPTADQARNFIKDTKNKGTHYLSKQPINETYLAGTKNIRPEKLKPAEKLKLAPPTLADWDVTGLVNLSDPDVTPGSSFEYSPPRAVSPKRVSESVPSPTLPSPSQLFTPPRQGTLDQRRPLSPIATPLGSSRRAELKPVEVKVLSKLKAMVDYSIENRLETLDGVAFDATPSELKMMEDQLTNVLWSIVDGTSPPYLTQSA